MRTYLVDEFNGAIYSFGLLEVIWKSTVSTAVASAFFVLAILLIFFTDRFGEFHGALPRWSSPLQ